MKIAVRMDDITPDMDWEKFNRFKEILDMNNIKPLIGVVPENHDDMLSIDEPHEDFWNYIKQLQKEGWVVAQHGVNHVYTTKKMGLFPLNRLSEFAGLSYDEQYELLAKGQRILLKKGITTDFFMAPAHSYDSNTLKALVKLGFKNITDGFGDYPYKYKNLNFYPISFKQSKTLKKAKGYSTFVVHTNTMDDSDFDKYKKFFMNDKEKFISYNEYLKVQAKRRNIFDTCLERVKAYGKSEAVRLRQILKNGKIT